MKSTHRKPRLIWITVALVTIAVLGLAGYKVVELMTLQKMAAEFSMPPTAVNVVAPRKIVWRPERMVPGFVEAAKLTPITTDVPGLVTAVHFESGQAVRKGDALVNLDDSLEVTRLQGLRAELLAAENDFARSQRLHQSRAISNAEWETARAKRDAMLAQKNELERVVAKKVIRAPFDGIVGLRDVHPGRYVAEGDALAELVSQNGPRLRFSMNVEDLPRLTEGATVTFAAGKTQGTARVTAVSPSVRSETRQVDVEARVEGACPLPAGAFVKVRVPLSAAKDLLGVPITAVKNQGGATVVFCVGTKDGKSFAEARAVHLGARVGDLRLIESGLKPGDHVVSMGAFKIKDGDAVLVTESPQPEARTNPAPTKG